MTITDFGRLAEMHGSIEKSMNVTWSRFCASFGTEAGLFQQLGISTVICGPGSIAQAHRADEYVALDQLDACLGLVGKLKHTLVGAI